MEFRWGAWIYYRVSELQRTKELFYNKEEWHTYLYQIIKVGSVITCSVEECYT